MGYGREGAPPEEGESHDHRLLGVRKREKSRVEKEISLFPENSRSTSPNQDFSHFLLKLCLQLLLNTSVRKAGCWGWGFRSRQNTWPHSGPPH